MKLRLYLFLVFVLVLLLVAVSTRDTSALSGSNNAAATANLRHVIQPPHPRDDAHAIAMPDSDAHQFVEMADEILRTLPSIERVRAETKDFHHTPPLVLEAGAKLGDVREALERNPRLIPQALDFYRSCARRTDFLDSVRALCLRNLKDWAAKGGLPTGISSDEIPDSISSVADRIPSSRA